MKQTRRKFVKTLFVASQAAVAGSFLPINLFGQDSPAPASAPDALNFLVMGDWGRQGERDQVEVAEQMGKTAQDVAARFVVAAGDNFYENGVASVQDSHWKKSFEDVYTAPSLQVTWYAILGNHDYHINPQAQVDYGKTSTRWRMPARYYMKSYQIDKQTTADFFFLDTTPMVRAYYNADFEEKIRANVMSQDVPKQIAWFKSALKASKAQWKVVFAHHPIYSGGEHGDQPELIQSILPILQENNIHADFNGHAQDLQHVMAGDVNLFCTGAGSSVRPTKDTAHTKFAESRSGFVSVSLGPDKMDIRMIDYEGKLLYTTSVMRAGAAVPAT